MSGTFPQFRQIMHYRPGPNKARPTQQELRLQRKRQLQSHRADKTPAWKPRLTLAVIGVGIAAPLLLSLGLPLAGCTVKGNISTTSGERIYHLPGQKYYTQTRIDWLRGERWFCSEEAARAAGWRKSYR